MNDDSGGHLEPDQRRRARHFTWIIACVLAGFGAAGLVYYFWHLTWLAVALVVIVVPLRWVAMLVADASPSPLRRRSRRQG